MADIDTEKRNKRDSAAVAVALAAGGLVYLVQRGSENAIAWAVGAILCAYMATLGVLNLDAFLGSLAKTAKASGGKGVSTLALLAAIGSIPLWYALLTGYETAPRLAASLILTVPVYFLVRDPRRYTTRLRSSYLGDMFLESSSFLFRTAATAAGFILGVTFTVSLFGGNEAGLIPAILGGVVSAKIARGLVQHPREIRDMAVFIAMTAVVAYFGGAALSHRGDFGELPLAQLFKPAANGTWFLLVGGTSLFFLVVAIMGAEKEAPSGPRRKGYRGRGLIKDNEAQEQVEERFGRQYRKGVRWGGVTLPDEASPTHFYITGTPGSGKSLTLGVLIKQAIDSIAERRSPTRVVVYDPKQELLPLVVACAPEVPKQVINPFDKRAAWWNLARDFCDDASADQLAKMLIPESEAGERYWTTAPRSIFAGLVKALNRARPGAWRLRDLLLILRDPPVLQLILNHSEDTRHLTRLHLEMEKTRLSLLSQLQGDLQPYESIAALWDLAERRENPETSIVGFTSEPRAVVVVSNNPKYSAALGPLYQLYILRLSDAVRSGDASESTTGGEASASRTWLVIDEAVTVGKLPGLKELMAEGRSRGACVALGFQDIHDMYVVYGEDELNGILGQCGNKAVLRIDNGVSAEAMSKQFGTREVVKTSTSMGPEGDVRESQDFSEEVLVLPKELMQLEPPNPGPVRGYYQTAFTDPYYSERPFKEFVKSLREAKTTVKKFEPYENPGEAQRLRPFDAADFERLGLKSGPSSSEPPPSAPPPPGPSGPGRAPRRGLFDDID